jgi:hypothetical protein
MVVLVKTAVPFDSAPVPNVPVASLKVTISPSGGVPTAELTLAVSVTLLPNVTVLGEIVKVVVETACTIWWSTDDVLGAKLASPL